jgi:hypothetical protein
MLNKKAPTGISTRREAGKFSGRFRNAITLSRAESKIIKMEVLIMKLIRRESPRRFVDSLSFFGSTMASS